MLKIKSLCRSLAIRSGDRSLHQPALLKIFFGATLATTGVLVPMAADAADGDSAIAIEWQCRQEYDAFYHVRCTAQGVQSEAAGANAGRVSSEVSRPASLQSIDLRPVALRGAGEVFSVHGWRVPLYTQPVDTAAVTQLLASVLCDAAPHCTVTYGLGGARSAGN
jgi:hypothetical protein